MQGGTFGPLMCSNSIDKIGKTCYERGELLFLYKKRVKLMPLYMVDYLLGVSRCGFKSVTLNSFINVQVELKKLKFHTQDIKGKSKCHKLHIGKPNHSCPNLEVHGTPMGQVSEDTYLGDVISSDGKNEKNIQSRISKGLGKITDILYCLGRIALGSHYFSIAMLMRESQFLNSVLTNAEVW